MSFKPTTKAELQTAVNLYLASNTKQQAINTYGNIKDWDVSDITDMSSIFNSKTLSDSDDITGWNVSKVTTMWGMFSHATFNQDISGWDVSNVQYFDRMFQSSTFNKDISNWKDKLSKVISMSYMFKSNSAFNQDISSWDVSNVQYFYGMFESATSFDQDIRNWDVSNGLSDYFYDMFTGATKMIANYNAPTTPTLDQNWWTLGAPQMVISGVISGHGNDVFNNSVIPFNSLVLYFEVENNGVITGFEKEDITISPSVGISTNDLFVMSNNSNSNYKSTLTLSNLTFGTTYTISIPKDKFTNSNGVNNIASTSLVFTCLKPEMTITSSDVNNGGTSNDSSINITFTSNVETTNFNSSDINTENGNISNFTEVNSITYNATFTPWNSSETKITVPANKFSGTFNTSVKNENESEFIWYYNDETAPTITLSALDSSGANSIDNGSTTTDSKITLQFRSSKSTTNFTIEDITTNGGTLSNFSGNSDGTFYTVTFTPSGDAIYTISVDADKFSDMFSNSNSVSDTFTWTYGTPDTTPPTMTITSSSVNSGDTSNDSTISLTFTSSENTTNFIKDDITISGGSLSNLSGSETTYTATLTPSVDATYTISVAQNKFTDAAGNNNSESNTFYWTYDSTAPTITGVTIASDNTTMTVTFSEAVYNTNSGSGSLEVSDFVFALSGGTATLSSTTPTSISESGNEYTLGVSLSGIPNGREILSVSPVLNSIYDFAGNVASILQSNNSILLNKINVVSFTISDRTLTAIDKATVTLVFDIPDANFDSNNYISVQNGYLSKMTSTDNKTWTGEFTANNNTIDLTNVLSLSEYTNSNGNTVSTSNYTVDICFTKDTIIRTDQGDLKIQDITNTNTICNEQILGITKTIGSDDYLVLIKKDALGENIPNKDTCCSGNHQIKYNSKMILAKNLIHLKNVNKINNNNEILYNILLKNHRSIFANNLVSETLDPNHPIAILHLDVVWNDKLSDSEKLNLCNLFFKKYKLILDANNKMNKNIILK